jgi:hypothetical protein
VVQCLPSKHKALSSKPHTAPLKKKDKRKRKKFKVLLQRKLYYVLFWWYQKVHKPIFFFCGV